MGFEEGADVVDVIVEEGRVAVGRLKGLPMDVTPLVVLGDAEGGDDITRCGGATVRGYEITVGR